ncbi:MAG: serine/threonine-protein kinase [Jaaginema sp. PMC 1079.18]|nr:serine/threonine-protein kinase [Jaaginema sp. PMC 1080.18]MEC4852267.1 serine/threonine-protein kinase [Jaaginema sp. PMC 1079.18]MEC4866255.1 serine/threonine-protein kinase [Jaaginema sp. PMC 1078.18]
MSYCLNPDCERPDNIEDIQFCQSCGSAILLRNRYKAAQFLGQGGFGRTFLGCDRDLPPPAVCVIKQLYFQSEQPALKEKISQLFHQEALRLHELGSHPQIPALLAYFQEKQHLYLVQEWIDGETLSPKLWQSYPDLEQQTWQLLRSILSILAFIHARQVIHRDIKPDNIMQRSGDGSFALIDFGIARMFTHTAIVGGATVVGTPGYMAPEQMHGKVLPASDLYSLGVTCLNLITGVTPNELYDAIAERWQWRDYLPSGVSLSPQLTKILNNLVHPSLRQRSQSAQAVLREVERYAPHTVSSPPPLPRDLANQSEIATVVSGEVTALPPTNPTVFSQPDPPPVQIDYTTLKELLSRRKWEAADDETWAILCQIRGKREGTYLFTNDIQALPCRDLKAIDWLWFTHSKGQFGWRIQKQIYTEVKGEYHLFCDRVGWPTYRLTSGQTFQYNRKAPPGHLPSRRWIGGYSWWQHAQALVERLDSCHIE